MYSLKFIFTKFIFIFIICLAVSSQAVSQDADVERLVAALLQETPMVEDLQQLCDEIGGRPTGSPANLKAVEWGLRKFNEAGVIGKKDKFTMPRFWLERSATAFISGDVSFTPVVTAMTFSTSTPETGLKAPLVDVGYGTEEDFKRVGDK